MSSIIAYIPHLNINSSYLSSVIDIYIRFLATTACCCWPFASHTHKHTSSWCRDFGHNCMHVISLLLFVFVWVQFFTPPKLHGVHDNGQFQVDSLYIPFPWHLSMIFGWTALVSDLHNLKVHKTHIRIDREFHATTTKTLDGEYRWAKAHRHHHRMQSCARYD